MNDEIDLSVDLEDMGMPAAKSRDCELCGKTVNVKGNGDLWKHACGPVVDINLSEPKDPKADWIEIIIDEVAGLSNSEEVGVNGVIYQIPRGIKTSVPPSVIGVLNNAIASRSVTVPDPLTGRDKNVKQHYNAIPWRKA